MKSLFEIPAGRRAKWLVFGFWIVAIFAIAGANLPGKFADAEKNESTSFLPGDAESTKTLEVTEELQDGDIAPTVIVYRREGGLTAGDRRQIAADVAQLNQATREFPNTTRFGNPAGEQARLPFQLSPDGTTALIRNEVRGTGEGEDLIDPVDRYREVVGEGGGGLEVKVGGAAGISADAIKVFDSINGTLLLAAGGLVFVLLILIYRSPFFFWFPLFAVIVAELTSRGIGFALTEAGVTVNGQSSSILSVLVLGAGTDYALLLVARYREELRSHEDKHEAMALALRQAGPAIFASGLTVCATLLSLSLAKVNGTSGLGPIGAMGIAVAMVVMLTFLPALLTIVGRRPFWPYVPHFGDAGTDSTHGAWRGIGEWVARRPAQVAAGSTALLLVMALGLLNFSTGLTQGNSFRDNPDSIQAQELVAQAFPRGQAVPTDIVVPRDEASPAQVAAAARRVEGVASVPPRPAGENGEYFQLAAFLSLDPYSTAAYDVVEPLRDAVRDVAPGALVGGPTAVEKDLRDASADDTALLVPIALVIVMLILIVLLRALVVPLLLTATVVLSFAAALGVGAVVFDLVFGFPGSDPSLPLFAFIFLVALGVDYNIFLMARVREETVKHGTREGMLRGLAVTGGVITSAGIVLAGTFAVLAALPLTFLTELGFVIAFGVLLDTFIVRSVLVPALVLYFGKSVWWPSRLAQRHRQPPPPEQAVPELG